MYRRHHQSVDDASLQTDVMRFMAIVAFCLIAILAMVRNIDAPPTAVTATAAPNTPPQAPPSEPGRSNTQTQPAEPVVVEQAVQAPPVVNTVLDEPVIEAPQTTAPDPAPLAIEQPQVVVPAAEQEPVAKPNIEAPQDNAPNNTKPEADQSLTLRFASDSDFLRLVARGKITVFAYNPDAFLALGADYRFQPATKPRQVYELHASTIPARLLEALQRSGEKRQMQWAVALPERIAKQISEHVRKHKSGELRIDRFQKVRHVLPG